MQGLPIRNIHIYSMFFILGFKRSDQRNELLMCNVEIFTDKEMRERYDTIELRRLSCY